MKLPRQRTFSRGRYLKNLMGSNMCEYANEIFNKGGYNLAHEKRQIANKAKKVLGEIERRKESGEIGKLRALREKAKTKLAKARSLQDARYVDNRVNYWDLNNPGLRFEAGASLIKA